MMTSEEAIRNLADTLQEAHSEAFRALRELRAQHDVKGVDIDQFKPAKLDRSRWEGCEYCIGDNPKSIGTFEIYDDVEIPEGAIKFKWVKALQYCPICGKPLTEEAWIELERRINHES